MENEQLIEKFIEKISESDLVMSPQKLEQDPILYKYQHIVTAYIPLKRLAVSIHDYPKSIEGRTYYDTRRSDLYLQGMWLLEFTYKDLYENFDDVVDQIVNYEPTFNNVFHRSSVAKKRKK